MKKLLIALLCIASSAVAEGTSMYDNVDAFLADLEQMAIRCGTMAEGQVDDEIYGIQFARGTEGRCILGTGDVDPLVFEFFVENDLSWAGMIDDNSIWVAAR
jgi:hypothetical protein